MSRSYHERRKRVGGMLNLQLPLPKTPSVRPTVVRAPHQIHSTRWHQTAVSPAQVTPVPLTPVKLTPVQLTPAQGTSPDRAGLGPNRAPRHGRRAQSSRR